MKEIDKRLWRTNMYVCLCKNIKESDIEKLVKSGVNTLKGIKKATHAGTQCKVCIPDIENTLKEMIGKCEKDLFYDATKM